MGDFSLHPLAPLGMNLTNRKQLFTVRSPPSDMLNTQ